MARGLLLAGRYLKYNQPIDSDHAFHSHRHRPLTTLTAHYYRHSNIIFWDAFFWVATDTSIAEFSSSLPIPAALSSRHAPPALNRPSCIQVLFSSPRPQLVSIY